MKQIIIRGTTGVGKSLYADGLERAAIEAGYKVEVSDHLLFTNHNAFERDLKKTQKSHVDAGADISIIVINDGERDLQVNFVHGVSHRLACILFVGIL
jgi:broad-specificity NMP kinase